MRQELFLVAIADKGEAVRAVQACLPDAEIKIIRKPVRISLRNIRSSTAKCSCSRRDRDPQEGAPSRRGWEIGDW